MAQTQRRLWVAVWGGSAGLADRCLLHCGRVVRPTGEEDRSLGTWICTEYCLGRVCPPAAQDARGDFPGVIPRLKNALRLWGFDPRPVLAGSLVEHPCR
ncbi:uncharacterized protein BDV17DRAFT_276827 [Aspergillus undulatus]|uniref:uncharacterized protein n=1 Tax=Aspergillus undulatus TaxID=1810928 RepID=UPI003CCE23D2